MKETRPLRESRQENPKLRLAFLFYKIQGDVVASVAQRLNDHGRRGKLSGHFYYTRDGLEIFRIKTIWGQA